MKKTLPPKVHYADYLQLAKLLNAQTPLAKNAHDELLFIVTHQAYELWFKLMHFELDSVLEIFASDFIDEKLLGVVYHRLQRLLETQKVLVQQFSILETMDPLDFLDFRHLLAPASGFQSIQFRGLEIKLGLKMSDRTKQDQLFFLSSLKPDEQEYLLKLEKGKGLIQEVNRWLERFPFLHYKNFKFVSEYKKAVEKMLQDQEEAIQNTAELLPEEREMQLKNLQLSREHFANLTGDEGNLATLAALFIQLYRDESILHLPYKVLTALVELDELISTWRYRHTIMVQRMIGMKIGTGGSSGYHYLMATTHKNRLFPELFQLPTFLIPKTLRPELPEDLRRALSLNYSLMEKK